MSLHWRIFLLNAVVLIAAAVLLLGPVTVSTPVLPGQALVIGAGLVAMLIANAVILRIALAPLGQLTRAMTTADLLRPGARPVIGGPAEVAELTETFISMLERMEAERAASSARVLSAQEAERQRIAQELHDEIGQTLTAVLLQLKHAADQAPAELRHDLRQAQETTRSSLDEIRRIARRLRPGVLEELGLHSALRSLAAEFTGSGMTVRHRFAAGLPALGEEAELVLYRVAQEGMTNIARHAGADEAVILLSPTAAGGVELTVRDNGKGIGQAPEGAGIRGMRERALLIGAALTLEPAAPRGTVLRLRVPPSPREAR
ncbi:sensor histidine kinase [Streptomyces polyrhachis]|uniref:histidine kinase n=1 Tax=Streptomyces polyrhachis TaxID=1282885 RepID=A0ABW2G897_9ACTN